MISIKKVRIIKIEGGRAHTELKHLENGKKSKEAIITHYNKY